MKKTTLRHLKVLHEYIVRLNQDMETTGPVSAQSVDGWRERLSTESLRIAMMLQYEEEDAEELKEPNP